MPRNADQIHMRMLPKLLLPVVVFLLLLFVVYPSHAAQWQQQERTCLSACPVMPRYGGIENDEQYKDRMRKQAAYDQCFMDCARISTSKMSRTFVPIGKPEAQYFKRNGYQSN